VKRGMKSPFNSLKDLGVPDQFASMIPALLLAISLSPWIEFGDYKINTPWFISLVSILVLMALFIPFIPYTKDKSAAEKEILHHFEWIRKNILVDALTVDKARTAFSALDGWGGSFRVSVDQFNDKHIEPIIREEKEYIKYLPRLERLRELSDEVPRNIIPGELVHPEVASALKIEAEALQ
jgi:hypothetical protein